jgi:hypothetical protein
LNFPNIFRREKPQGQLSTSPKVAVSVGKKSTDYASSLTSYQHPFAYLPRQFQEWHQYNLEKLSSLQSTDLLRLLVYVEPTCSHAISNYLRVFDSGFFLTARKSNGSIHSQGQKYFDDLIDRLNNPMSDGFSPDTSVSNFYLQEALSLLMDGADAGELVFGDGYKVSQLCHVDPMTITFKAKGSRVVPVQGMGSDEIPLDYRNFFYIPVDPIAGDPYGTNQIISVIQTVMNKFRLLQDFARALHNLGFDRIDISVSQEQILAECKARAISDPQKIVDRINEVVTQAQTSMQDLAADENPTHSDTVTLSTLTGQNANKGLDIQAIVNVLLSDMASALKSYATILGKRFGGSTEGYTSIEALLFIKLIQGFQAILKRLLDRMFTLALQVDAGIQAYADWQWLEPSLRPEYESAQYFAAYSLLLWEEEKMGTISTSERDAMARRMLRVKGDKPSDAVRDEDFSPQGKNNPQRDVTQEKDKEGKRKETNKDKRSTGD